MPQARTFFSVAVMIAAFNAVGLAQKPTFNASVRMRAESWGWFDTPLAKDSYLFGGALARVAVSQQRSSFGWRVEAAAPALVGLPDNATAPAPRGQLGLGASYSAANDGEENTASVFLKQAFIRFGAAPGKSGGFGRAGRFEFIEGLEVTPANATLAAVKRDRVAHRLIGNFGFSHVQRSADGIHIGYETAPYNFTAAGFRPTRGVFDVEGWDNLDITVGYAAISRSAAAQSKGADMRLFAIYYDDNRDVLKVDNRPLAVRTADAEDISLWTFGGHYARVLPAGKATFDVLLWGALQTGDWGVLGHRANAFAIEAGVQPAFAPGLKPWLRAGYNRSTGDDAAGSDHGTFFQLLPTPRIYARMPFYNMMNMEDAFASLVLRPSASVTMRMDARMLRLASDSDLWYAGGGAFEKESFGYAGRAAQGSTDFANVFDISADVRISRNLSATGFAALARGGAVIERIYAGTSGSFGYLELEWRR